MDMDCSFERVDEWWKEEKVDGGGNETRMESLHGAMEEMEENNVRLPILERVNDGSETGVDCEYIEMRKGRQPAGLRMGARQIGGEQKAESSFTNRTPSRRKITPNGKPQRMIKENKRRKKDGDEKEEEEKKGKDETGEDEKKEEEEKEGKKWAAEREKETKEERERQDSPARMKNCQVYF